MPGTENLEKWIRCLSGKQVVGLMVICTDKILIFLECRFSIRGYANVLSSVLYGFEFHPILNSM